MKVDTASRIECLTYAHKASRGCEPLPPLTVEWEEAVDRQAPQRNALGCCIVLFTWGFSLQMFLTSLWVR